MIRELWCIPCLIFTVPANTWDPVFLLENSMKICEPSFLMFGMDSPVSIDSSTEKEFSDLEFPGFFCDMTIPSIGMRSPT